MMTTGLHFFNPMTPEIKWSELSERERDALVAEKVMGWKCDKPKSRHEEPRWRYGSITVGWFVRDFKPSTDESTAMLVLREFSEWAISSAQVAQKKGRKREYVVEIKSTLGNKMAIHESLPEAICLAALRSTGLNISEV